MVDDIHVDVSRADLARMSLAVSLRHRSTLLLWGVVAALVAASLVLKHGLPTSGRGWSALSIAVLVGATGATVVALAISLLYVVAAAGHGTGVLGRHTYTVTADGLFERTAANETLVKWGGVRDLRRTASAIYVGVAPAMYHVIPRRAFDGDASYESFWAANQPLRRAGGVERGRA
jgi:YcxB-like protein